MDAGHKYADDILEKIAEQIAKSLDKTGRKAIRKIKDYLQKHQHFIEDLNKQVEDGTITEREYEQQMINNLTTGKKWSKVRDEVSMDMSIGTEDALKATAIFLTGIYLYNRNFTNDRIETVLKANSGKSVRMSRHKTHDPITPVKLNRKKNYRWHKRKIESVVRQGMKKGYSIDKIARNIERVTSMDRHSAIRTARTAVTAAENMARIDSYAEAEEMGISMRKQWYATKDSRTRTSHRAIDGENIPWNEYFSNGLFYPADPYGDPAEVYNCRCTLLGEADGISLLSVPTSPSGMGRYEWVGETPIPKHYDESKRAYEKRVREMKK